MRRPYPGERHRRPGSDAVDVGARDTVDAETRASSHSWRAFCRGPTHVLQWCSLALI